MNLKRLIVILSLSSTSLNSFACGAEAPGQAPTCPEVLSACAAAYDARVEELRLSDLALTQSKDNSVQLTKEVEEANAKLDSLWRNPYVLIGVGLLGGAILFKN
jgi:hypothetical protein